MKISKLLAGFLLIPVLAHAQVRRVMNDPNYDRKPIHFGFTVGFNLNDATIDFANDFYTQFDTVYGIENIPSMGFHLGPVVNFRLGEYFDYRPLINLSFGQKNLDYRLLTQEDGQTTFTNHMMQIESVWVEFPQLIKYKAVRLNNVRPYLIAGFNPKFDLAARKKIKEEEQPKIRLDRFDLYYEVGFGIDYYLPYFKFSTEFKYGVGLGNVVVPDQTEFTSAYDRINAKIFMISFHFE